MLIPKNVLEILSSASKDSFRYQLNGVRLERESKDSCSATATDGKQLTHVKWMEPGDADSHPDYSDPVDGFRATVPLSDCKPLMAMVPKTCTRPIFGNIVLDETQSNGKLPFTVTNHESSQNRVCASIEGTYPDCKPILDDCGGGASMLINPLMLAEQLKTVAKVLGFTKKSTGTVKIEFRAGDPEKHPLKISGKNATIEVVGMVMPLVVERKTS